MSEALFLLGFVTAQRAAELLWAERNTLRLRKAGAVEFGRSQYRVLVAVHGFWLGGLWLLGPGQPVNIFFLTVFLILQAGRIWVLATLGRRWTTRVIVLPGVPLIRQGPYRWVSHPNYIIVAGELAVVPLALGLPLFALLFFLLNAAVLAARIRIENAALSWSEKRVAATAGARTRVAG